MRAWVPASIANLGSGFDVHSVALQVPAIEIEFWPAPAGSRSISVTGPYSKDVTTDVRLHASSKALAAVQEQFEKPDGYALQVNVKVPPRKGLGLSGAEAVGAVLCADFAFHLGLSRKVVARLAAEAEPSRHIDNVAASALGGFNIITRSPTDGTADIATIPPPPNLGVCVVVPDIEKSSTEATRNCLPHTVPMNTHIESVGYASKASASFAARDVNAIIDTLSWDPVVEPARANAGVYGKGINAEFLLKEKQLLLGRFHVAETMSGAGPSRALWYSIAEDRRAKRKNKVGLIQPAIELVSNRLESVGHRVSTFILTKPTAKGATIVRSRN